MSDRPLWVVIPKWERFQHYRDRNPVWIKAYVELTHDPAWSALTFHQRGVLLSLWLEYAASHRRIVGSTSALSRRLGHRVTTETLDALSGAGFIRLSASKPLARRYHAASPEGEGEGEPPSPPQTRGAKLSRKDLRKFTGCEYRRGTHSSAYVHAVLGTAKPPPDWPYPPPTVEEIEAALNGSQGQP